jgi:hypothetical protein
MTQLLAIAAGGFLAGLLAAVVLRIPLKGISSEALRQRTPDKREIDQDG